MQNDECVRKHLYFTNCGAKLQLFLELTKYFLYFCRKYLKIVGIMNKKLKDSLRVIPSMGMTFIVLGVLLLAASFAFSMKSNIMLFAGLFFVLAGVAGFVYSLKKG